MNREFDHEHDNSYAASAGRSRRRNVRAEGREESLQREEHFPQKQKNRPPQKPQKRSHYWHVLIATLICLEAVFLAALFLLVIPVKKKLSVMPAPEANFSKETNSALDYSKVQEMQGYWTVALFGVDSRNGALGKGNNSDVIILCTVNRDNGEIKLTSVYRDTYLNINGKNQYNKINMAYAEGGADQAGKALNRNLDLQIDNYATFNWKAVVDAINILGGVDVEITDAEFYYINAFITETVKGTGVGSYQLKHAGMNHLDGVQAVAYARLRKMDTDYARTERQRKIIELAFQKLKTADFAKINNVMEVVMAQIQTDITIDDLIPLAKSLTKFTIADTEGFPAARSDGMLGKKGACVIPATLESNVKLLHQFHYGDDNYTPSSTVKTISAKIASDTGVYKEGQAVKSVGTDKGVVPKTTAATKAKETSASTKETSGKETKESETDKNGKVIPVIDGEKETDLELETDRDGNIIDPPETESSETTSKDKTTKESTSAAHETSAAHPGESTTAAQPGPHNATTAPEQTAPVAPGTVPATTAATNETTRANGPGASTPTTSPVQIESIVPQSSAPNNSGGPGSVITGPGVN